MLRRYARLIPLLLALILVVPADALANPFELQLANGLRVIVKEDHRAPTAAHMVWYHAGSMDETNGTTGVAHLLEHMMFKGTPTTGAGEFSRLVAAEGGRDNAFTSKDYTCLLYTSRSMAASRRNSVDFPAPEWPLKYTISPALISKLTSLSASSPWG